jgi:hypothetical protein
MRRHSIQDRKSLLAPVLPSQLSECELPDNWLDDVVRSETPLEALEGACALVIATQWPEYQEIVVDDVENIAGQLVVFDSNRFLSDFNKSSVISYFSVGVGA